MNFEDDLRTALRREPAPPDFAAGVLAKTVLARTPLATPRLAIVPAPLWRRPAVLALAAVLILAALIPQAVMHRRREQKRALQARDQLIAALSITRVQLQQAKEKIRQNTRHAL